MFLIGARALLRDNQRLWPWLLYPWLYFAVYALANPLIFRWYLTPPLPAYLFVILAGLQQLLGLFRRASKDQVSQMIPAAWLKVAVFGLPLLLVLRGWTLHPDHGLDRPAPEMAWYDLELQYRKAAATLVNDPSVSKSAVLAAGDVGVLGFDTAMQILDTVGLNSPQAIRYYPTDPSYYVNAYAVSPQLILDQQPDFVILLEVYGREGLFKNADFLTQYRLRDTIDTAIYGSEGMLIYERITVNGRYTK